MTNNSCQVLLALALLASSVTGLMPDTPQTKFHGKPMSEIQDGMGIRYRGRQMIGAAAVVRHGQVVACADIVISAEDCNGGHHAGLDCECVAAAAVGDAEPLCAAGGCKDKAVAAPAAADPAAAAAATCDDAAHQKNKKTCTKSTTEDCRWTDSSGKKRQKGESKLR